MKNGIKDDLMGILLFAGTLWLVYFADLVLPGKWALWGITPRTLWGLVGIPLSPFLHSGLGHLMGNSIPLVVLLCLLSGSRTRTWETVIEIVILGGGLLWLFGRGGSADSGLTTHVGASGLIYGLIAFLIVAGFREKRPLPMLVAVVVGVLYGSTLVFGVLPSIGSGISWDGHLTSAIAGGGLAYFTLGGPAESDTSSDLSPISIPGGNL